MQRLRLFLLLGLLPTTLFAFQLTPMSHTFTSTENSFYFTLTNESNKHEAVQISMAKRVMDKKGKESHPEVEDEFLIYPDQLILKPKERRRIKVQYLKREIPTIEQAYRLIAEQLPINLKKKSERKTKTNITLLLRYMASIYVAPKKKTIKFEVAPPLRQDKKLLIQITNKGSTHFLLKNLQVALKSESKEYQFKTEELKGMNGENVLAGNSRQFLIPFPEQIKSSKYKLGIHFDQE